MNEMEEGIVEMPNVESLTAALFKAEVLIDKLAGLLQKTYTEYLKLNPTISLRWAHAVEEVLKEEGVFPPK